MWQTGRQSSVTEKVIFRKTEDKKLSKSGASSRRCVSARQRIGNYLPNCSEPNETLTKKIFQVRANFSRPKGSLGNNLQSSVVVKRLTKAERAEVPKQGAIGRRASTKRRALFASEADLALSTVEVTNADPEPKPLLKTRDARTQTKPQLANTEEKRSSVDVSNFPAFEIFHDCVVQPDLALANQNDSKDFG